MDIIEENPKMPWDWRALSVNPNLTFDIIKKNDDKEFNYYLMSYNPFTGEKKLFQERKKMEYMAAYRIQQRWREITLSPRYALGRRFIEKKWLQLMAEE